MEERIQNYLIHDLECSEEVAKTIITGLMEQKDIYDEFKYWFEHREFVKENPVTIDGYTAESLFEQFPILEIGAYDLLVALRTDHDETLDYIKRGLPR